MIRVQDIGNSQTLFAITVTRLTEINARILAADLKRLSSDSNVSPELYADWKAQQACMSSLLSSAGYLCDSLRDCLLVGE